MEKIVAAPTSNVVTASLNEESICEKPKDSVEFSIDLGVGH